MKSSSFALAAFAVATCFQVARAQSDPYAAIPARMEQFVADHEIPGAVTLVSRDGKTVHLAAVGMADIEKKTPLTTDSIFGVMSMTKPITATALMILVDEGKVALDDPVEKYIPSFADAKLENGDAVKALTIRRLLTHTSGLTGDQSCSESLEATAAALAKRPFKFQPDARWEYGPSMNVVGRIIEIASGKPYDEFLAERLFQPLGMKDATFHLAPEQRPRLAALYAADGGEMKHADRWGDAGEPGCVPNPSGGVFATAADMARFYNAILNGGELDGVRIVSADAVKQMTTLHSGAHETGFTPCNGWGLGWCLTLKPEGVTAMLSPGTYGHGGAYGTQGWVDPQRKAVFVLLTQRSNFPNSDGSEVRSEFQRLAVEALEK